MNIRNLATVLAITIGHSFWSSAQVINIPDAELQTVIRNVLDKPTGEITAEDMASLTELDASYYTRHGDYSPSFPLIDSLEGLQSAVNITNLDLSGLSFRGGAVFISANITTEDLSPLRGLTNLSRLDLFANRLTNPVLPNGLTRLSTLAIAFNQLTNLTLPDDMVNLKELNLAVNGLVSLDLPEELINLSRFHLVDNSLTNITLPKELRNLTYLNLRDNNLSGLSLPEELAKLDYLILQHFQWNGVVERKWYRVWGRWI